MTNSRSRRTPSKASAARTSTPGPASPSTVPPPDSSRATASPPEPSDGDLAEMILLRLLFNQGVHLEQELLAGVSEIAEDIGIDEMRVRAFAQKMLTRLVDKLFTEAPAPRRREPEQPPRRNKTDLRTSLGRFLSFAQLIHAQLREGDEEIDVDALLSAIAQSMRQHPQPDHR